MICQLSYAQRHNDRSRVEWGPRDNSFVQMRNDDETLKSPPHLTFAHIMKSPAEISECVWRKKFWMRCWESDLKSLKAMTNVRATSMALNHMKIFPKYFNIIPPLYVDP